MRFVLLFLSSLFLISCDPPRLEDDSHIDFKSKFANEALRKTAVKLQQERNLSVCGSGGQMMDQIKMLGLSFNYYEPIDIENGRELLISAVNALSSTVNEDERIHPYLHNYPFTEKNVEIRIFLYNPDGLNTAAGKLSVIRAIRGVFSYDIDDPEIKFWLKTIFTETYEEALQKQKIEEQPTERVVPLTGK